MDRDKLFVVVAHATVVGFAAIGVLVSGFDYSYERDAPVLSKLNIAEAVANRVDSKIIYDMISAQRYYANYQYDPRPVCLIPFLSTLLVSGSLLVGSLFWRDFYKYTTVLNTTLVLWLTHFSFLISYFDERYLPDEQKQFFKSPFGVIVALHCLMLCLMFPLMITSGRFIRINKIKWPSCHCLKIFTIDNLCVCARFGMSLTLFLVGFNNSWGYGLRPVRDDNEAYCYEYSCSNIRFPDFAFYISTASSFIFFVFSSEQLLSLIWGSGHKTWHIITSFIAGWSCIILPSIFTAYAFKVLEARYSDGNFIFSVAAGTVHLFHCWNMWSNWNFISSPPDVLQILCGVKKNNENTEEEEVEHQNNVDSVNETNNVAVPTRTASVQQAKPVEKVRCLVINLCILILSLVLASLMGISIDISYYNRSNRLVSSELFLISVLTACIIKSLSELTTLLATKAPPPTSSLQLLADLFIECSLMTAAVVGALFTWRSTIGIVTSCLTILIILLKIINVVKANAVTSVIGKLAADYKVNQTTTSLSPTQTFQNEELDTPSENIDFPSS